MNSGRAVRRRSLKLYWCTTADHGEDWFVIARDVRQARRFHEDAEGFGPGDAEAELVVRLPDSLQDDRQPGWPSNEDLLACGAEIQRGKTPRVVVINGIRYVEGLLEHALLQATDNFAERHGRGRPNKTQREGPAS